MQNINEIAIPNVKLLGNSELQKSMLIDCANKINEIIRAITTPSQEAIDAMEDIGIDPGQQSQDTNNNGTIEQEEIVPDEFQMRAQMEALENEAPAPEPKKGPGRPKNK